MSWSANKCCLALPHSSICPAPHPLREWPLLPKSLGTADKGGYQELHPLPRKAGWVIATGASHPLPRALVNHQEHCCWENVIPLTDTTAPSCTSPLPVT